MRWSLAQVIGLFQENTVTGSAKLTFQSTKELVHIRGNPASISSLSTGFPQCCLPSPGGFPVSVQVIIKTTQMVVRPTSIASWFFLLPSSVVITCICLMKMEQLWAWVRFYSQLLYACYIFLAYSSPCLIVVQYDSLILIKGTKLCSASHFRPVRSFSCGSL